MDVGDSAEEFMLIHILGRETLPALSCDLRANPLKIVVFARRERIEIFCLCSLNTSHQMCF